MNYNYTACCWFLTNRFESILIALFKVPTTGAFMVQYFPMSSMYTTAKKKRPNQLGYFGYNQLHAMLSLWANWFQLNSQLNSPGVSFWLYRTYMYVHV